jgi:hypothetical protein
MHEGFVLCYPVYVVLKRFQTKAQQRHAYTNPPVVYFKNDDEERHCVLLFTDEDLANKWRSESQENDLCKLEITTPSLLADYLKQLDTSHATHVVIDLLSKKRARPEWVYALPELLAIVQVQANQNT